MNEDLRSRALERAQAAARASRTEPKVSTLAEEPPRAGDVLLHPALRALPVQWAVISSESGDDLKVVPADTGSMVGSGDVALADLPGVGRVTARCRFVQPLSPAALAGAQRSGRLSAEGLARIERRRSELGAGRKGSFTEIETDEDPEYEDWLADVVEPACRQWQELAVAKTLPFRPVERSAYWQLRWAAGIFLVLGLGALGGLFFQGGRISKLQQAIERQRVEAANREAEHAARERRLSEQISKAEQARRAAEITESTTRDQLAAAGEELHLAREAALVINPALASLEPSAAVRGEVKAISLPAQASHLLLFLPVDQIVGGTLRLEILGADGRLLWERKSLDRQKGHEISVGVPAALLPSGELILRLYRRERGKEVLVREHRLQVERENATGPAKRLLP
jgi:hypothetical protein